MTISLNRPLSIGLLSYRSNPHCGGQGVYINHLSRSLKALGHHVEVISGPPEPVVSEGIPVHRFPGLDLYNPDNLFRTPSLRELSDPINLMEWFGVCTMGFPEPYIFGIRAHRFLRRRYAKYDIIHDNQSLSYGVRAISRQTPTIATIHHPITVDRTLAVRAAPTLLKKVQQLRWYSFVGMQKRVARTFSRIITVSKCARRDIAQAFNIPEHRFRVVPNGIDTERFFPRADVEKEKNRIIVTNSADTPLKGLRYLLLAVKQISARHKVRLTVVGAPRKNGHIARLIHHLGIGPQITFTGRIDDTEFTNQYARAFLAVVPSIYEGFGLPAGEAMACGLPVVSTSGGALAEVVGDAGLLVPPANADALAGAITRLLDYPELALEMGRRGYKRIRERFTWEKAARQTVSAYCEAIDDYRRFSAPAPRARR